MNWINLNKDNFGFVKYFAYLAGIWPYHTTIERYIYCGLIVIVLTFVLYLPETLPLYVFRHDTKVIMESCVVAIMNIISTTKFIINLYNNKLIRNLFDQAKKNLTTCTSKEEYNILQDYTKLGDVMGKGWAAIVFTGSVFYCLEPLSTSFLNRFIDFDDGNNTHRFAVPLYIFGIDPEKYYYPVFVTSGILIMAVMNITVVADSMFIALLEHAAGLFAVTGQMMNNIPTEEDLKNGTKNSSLTLEKLQYQYYVNCIKKHKRAIKFACDLETTYVWCFGIVTLLNIPLISFTVTQVTFQAGNLQEIGKYAFFGVGQLIHLFVDCFLSQQLINSSLNIQEALIAGKWYVTSPRVQKLLTLITLRSQHACKLTAGKVAILSLETYTTLVKTAGSYFTVLTSMQ